MKAAVSNINYLIDEKRELVNSGWRDKVDPTPQPYNTRYTLEGHNT